MVLLNMQRLDRGHGDRCPICREPSLLELLAPEALFSRRAQAVLASGVLALSVGATGTSIAAEGDRRHEGIVVPDQPRQGDAQADDLGTAPSTDTALPIDMDASPVRPDGDLVPLEHEPADDPVAEPPVVGEEAPPPEANPTPIAPAPERSTRVVPKPLPYLQPNDPPPAAVAPTADSRWRTSISTVLAGKQAASMHDATLGQRAPAADGPMQAKIGDAEAAPGAANTTAPAQPEPTHMTTVVRNARFHLVKPGESLWSIATALLGPGAAGAKVAREVQRLWTLNKHRIGTADPDLLPIGVRLRLR